MNEIEKQPRETIQPRSSLIFISHDTRDAELAEAFSRLLSSVSAGVLKSFRSSDKKGNQGIEYGVEWYPEIMKKLEVASDVVCLLTPNSVGRPWLLYEAGVAKGKLDTPVHGIALGIPLQAASTGPFAQFQNSDDSEDALTQLVMQLVKRIPNSEPDREVVKAQVTTFRAKVDALTSNTNQNEPDAGNDTPPVAKLFEEVKVMFQDLPRRISRSLDADGRSAIPRRRRFPASFVEEIVFGLGQELPDGVPVLIAASFLREDFPWLYELLVDAQRKISTNDPAAASAVSAAEQALHLATRHPVFREDFRFRHRGHELDMAITSLRDYFARNGERSTFKSLRVELDSETEEKGEQAR